MTETPPHHDGRRYASADPAVMRELDQIQRQLSDLREKIDDVLIERVNKLQVELSAFKPEDYVNREEFKPMERLFWFVVFSFAGLIVTAVGALLFQSVGNKVGSAPSSYTGTK